MMQIVERFPLITTSVQIVRKANSNISCYRLSKYSANVDAGKLRCFVQIKVSD